MSIVYHLGRLWLILGSVAILLRTIHPPEPPDPLILAICVIGIALGAVGEVVSLRSQPSVKAVG